MKRIIKSIKSRFNAKVTAKIKLKTIRSATVPKLNLPDDEELLKDFSQEAQRYLMSARNSLLVLESVSNDPEALDSIFKAFHTVKGLADFLKLSDIRDLTKATETLLDLLRKELLDFTPAVVNLVTKIIDRLQEILEVLEDQIKNSGTTQRAYPAIDDLLAAVQIQGHKTKSRKKSRKNINRAMPVIHNINDTVILAQMNRQLASPDKTIAVNRETVNSWLTAFQTLSQDLREAQTRLQERQRELIREREVAVRLTQQARQESRIKGEYLSHMAHEIRTLLSAIIGFTDLLKEGGLNDKQREHLNTIVLSGNMMFEIVNHILDYAKVEAGKLSIERIDFNLDRVIEDVFRVIRPRLLTKPIDLYFTVNERVPRDLVGDPTRLKQIFINLLDNAIKFTEKGEIGLEVQTDRAPNDRSQPDRVVLRFQIKDSGIGIPADRIDHIFESFTQASESTARLYGGSGLGLTLCKSFIEAMGGTISVESKLGQGSRFIFTLTLGISSTHSPSVQRPEFSGASILIVDSHAASTNTLLSLCQKFKVHVLPPATTAKQALEYLLKTEADRKSLPAVIFVDSMLAEHEGYQLAKKIRQQERYRAIKLVGTSSDVKITGSQEFQQAGFDLFLAKPFISGEVADILTQLLGDQVAKPTLLSPKRQDQISCKGIRILVVEDSLPNQELLKIHFDALGCVCDYAKNGKDAVEKVRTTSYDLCFMDLQMPVMGGLEATKIIRRELKSAIPIVALTAAEFQEEKDKCYEMGMNDYLSKPFGPDQLKEKILKCTKI